MTFAARLLLTILAVVLVITATTLLIAQQQNSVAYGALVDQLLRERTAAFQQEHETRHRLALEQAEVLADSVRLFAALEAADPEVYKIAADELNVGQFDFFRLLDASGRIIPPPDDGRAGRLDPDSLTGPLAPAGGVPPESDVQLGFVGARPTAGAAPRLYRLLAAPIGRFERRVGTLILGQRLRTLDAEPAGGEAPALRSALWTDGRLLGAKLHEPLASALTDTLAAEPAAADGELQAGEVRYRFQRSRLNPHSAYAPADLVSVFSLAGLEAEQRELRERIGLIGLGAFAVAGLIALALSRQLARPVAELVAATRQIRAGNYDLRLRPFGTRELATLAQSFNDMAAGLALKDRYHSVLQQVADPQVAEGLISGRVKLGGELRDVTVMFCDIRQYTALTVGRTPEVVIELLNHHLSAMTRVIQAHGGVINQFAGDAIMALFGAPQSYGDDAERAVRCALAMMAERERLNRDAQVPIRIGIGLASGPMVAGCIGAENRSDYTVVGARVNLAARLSSAAAAGEILIDEETRGRVAAVVATEPLPPLTLKGFSDPVPAHRVVLDRSAAAA
ncbi:MAG TPA: adenylate/guanylate cyclase domain-containing protein [Pseudomonadales bacterium]